jgi:ABC-type multidrug transport system fused ATPase/permease subunit
VVAFVGMSGAGKSTLMDLLPRFHDVTSGRILLDGHDLRSVTQTSLRAQMGIVTQETFLFSDSIYYNIAYGRPEASSEEVVRAARQAHAHDFIVACPEAYDTLVGERGVRLSGGQRQRIAIARALILDPRILILDDATASVDATTEARIRLGLREAMKGRTTLIVAHRLSTIALADELVVLDRGGIVARGTQAELLERSPVFREIYEHGLLEREFAERVEAAGA